MFKVTKGDRLTREFKALDSRLHYCDTRELTGTVLVNTVDEKKAKYTGRAYKQASLARRIQDVIGRPSTRDYHKIVLDGISRTTLSTNQT